MRFWQLCPISVPKTHTWAPREPLRVAVGLVQTLTLVIELPKSPDFGMLPAGPLRLDKWRSFFNATWRGVGGLHRGPDGRRKDMSDMPAYRTHDRNEGFIGSVVSFHSRVH